MVLPKGNEADLEDAPEAVRQAMTVHLLSDVSEVLSLALDPAAVGVTAEGREPGQPSPGAA